MTRLCLLLAAVVLVLGSAYVSVQARPDFSGLWRQNMEKSSKTSLQSYTNRIEQKGDTLTITTITGGSRGENSYDRTYVIGKESQSSDREGDQFSSVVKWKVKHWFF